MSPVADGRPPRARRLTVAVLAGLVSMGFLAFLATLSQTPGLEGPVEIAPIAVLVTVLGVVALPLVRWDDVAGYAAAVLAGAGAVVGIALYVVGAFGPTRVAPAAYLFAALGAVLVLTSVTAWRNRATSPDQVADP